jgi:hypothetical protein
LCQPRARSRDKESQVSHNNAFSHNDGIGPQNIDTKVFDLSGKIFKKRQDFDRQFLAASRRPFIRDMIDRACLPHQKLTVFLSSK